jgi:hypothetical protein
MEKDYKTIMLTGLQLWCYLPVCSQGSANMGTRVTSTNIKEANTFVCLDQLDLWILDPLMPHVYFISTNLLAPPNVTEGAP